MEEVDSFIRRAIVEPMNLLHAPVTKHLQTEEWRAVVRMRMEIIQIMDFRWDIFQILKEGE